MTEPTQDQIQLQLRADGWTYDPQLERVIQRLEANPDDTSMASLRMQVGYYKAGRDAARRAGRDVTGDDR